MIKALDLFCKAGGATKGLQMAGCYVVGVDIEAQPHYPGEEFHQADALTFPLEGYDFYWASPPCQKWGQTKALTGRDYPDLITPIRERLLATGKPFIIENVPGAPLIAPLKLCGTMFGLRVRRHRLFECHPPIFFAPASCGCKGRVGFTGAARGVSAFTNGAKLISVAGHNFNVQDAREAMGIDWMIRTELAQAVPPLYSFYLVSQLIKDPGGIKKGDRNNGRGAAHAQNGRS